MSAYPGQPRITQYHGIYSAVVHSNNDPLGEGRVKLVIPQITGLSITNWANPVSTATIPSAGQAVLAMFLGGDVNYPVYFLIGLHQDASVVLTTPNLTLNAPSVST